MGCSDGTLPQACGLRSRSGADSVHGPPTAGTDQWRSCRAAGSASMSSVRSSLAADSGLMTGGKSTSLHATEPVRELEYPTPDATHTLLASWTASAGKRDGPTITAIIGEPTAATTQAIGDAPAGYVSSSPCAAPATERSPDRPAALSHPSCDPVSHLQTHRPPMRVSP